MKKHVAKLLDFQRFIVQYRISGHQKLHPKPFKQFIQQTIRGVQWLIIIFNILTLLFARGENSHLEMGPNTLSQASKRRPNHAPPRIQYAVSQSQSMNKHTGASFQTAHVAKHAFVSKRSSKRRGGGSSDWRVAGLRRKHAETTCDVGAGKAEHAAMLSAQGYT